MLKRRVRREDDVKKTIEAIRLNSGSGRTLWTAIFNLEDLTMQTAFKEQQFSLYYDFSF